MTFSFVGVGVWVAVRSARAVDQLRPSGREALPARSEQVLLRRHGLSGRDVDQPGATGAAVLENLRPVGRELGDRELVRVPGPDRPRGLVAVQWRDDQLAGVGA